MPLEEEALRLSLCPPFSFFLHRPCLVLRASNCWDWPLCAGGPRTFLPIRQIRQLRLHEVHSHGRGTAMGSMSGLSLSTNHSTLQPPPVCLSVSFIASLADEPSGTKTAVTSTNGEKGLNGH